MSEAERWVPVFQFEGLYEVSNAGRVRRIGKAARTGNGRGGGVRVGRILKPQKHRGGYLAVQLWKNGKMSRPLVHTVVARAFLGPPPEGKEVNHLDADKQHNAIGNLEYVTRSENMRHAYANGLRPPVVSPTTKLNVDVAREIRARFAEGGISMRALGKLYGVGHHAISDVVNNRRWTS